MIQLRATPTDTGMSRAASFVSLCFLLACRPSAIDMPEPPPAVVDTVLPAGDGEPTTGTAGPRDEPPRLVAIAYDPAADPRNAEGWDLAAERRPDDPADARKAPFGIEALYELAGVGAPLWSPDGAHLLFAVTRHDLEAGKSSTDLWVADPAAGATRQLTRHEGYDGEPSWGPDGRSFVFVSGREDGSQLWRMSIDGGEPERLTSLSTGVGEPQWSPDGRRVAFVSSVFPEHGADDAANRAAIEAMEAAPTKAHLADELLYRHWTHWDDGRRDHILVLDLETKEIVDVTPGEHDSPVFRQGEPGFAFSPDGQEICFVSNRAPAEEQARSTNKDLYVVPVTGGKARVLTGDNPAYDGQPSYSPDGRFIAYRRQAQPGYESDEFELALYERSTGRVRILTDAFHDWVDDLRWAPDSGSLVFQAPVKGRRPLFRVPVEEGTIERLALPSSATYDLGPDGRLAFTFGTVGTPL